MQLSPGRRLSPNRYGLLRPRYCQVKVIGARPAHRRLTQGLVKHTLRRSKQRRHEPAAFSS
jgi:hypothetical protein